MKAPPLCEFYVGILDRSEAEKILRKNGCKETDLVEGYQHDSTGLFQPILEPIKRDPNRLPASYFDVPVLHIDLLILKQNWRQFYRENPTANCTNHLYGKNRSKLLKIALKTLHLHQPWYYENMSRSDAEKVLYSHEVKDNKKTRSGVFVLRRKSHFCLALSVLFERRKKRSTAGRKENHPEKQRNLTVNHYKVDFQLDSNTWGIDDGPRFETVIQLLHHYWKRSDRLCCRLREAVMPRKNGENLVKSQPLFLQLFQTNSPEFAAKLYSPNFTLADLFDEIVEKEIDGQFSNLLGCFSVSSQDENHLAVKTQLSQQRSSGEDDFKDRIDENGNLKNENETDESLQSQVEKSSNHIWPIIPQENIRLAEVLGSGNFGEVWRGELSREFAGMDQFCSRDVVQVAVKTVKRSFANDESQRTELIREFAHQIDLIHAHIVRIFGLSLRLPGNNYAIVMELCPLGDMKTFLRRRRPGFPATLNGCDMTFSVENVIILIAQVADGMAYLSRRAVLHRDLALRNILLTNERCAKICDFGLARVLDRPDSIYLSQSQGDIPLKWYAPESILYRHFTSKSDVWSYGVTVWEALSYGDDPYNGLDKYEIVRLLESGQRLAQPPLCPVWLYQSVITPCWRQIDQERPDFEQLLAVYEEKGYRGSSAV